MRDVSAQYFSLLAPRRIEQSSISNLLWSISVDGGLEYCVERSIFLVSISVSCQGVEN
jgi:hypothetical protein